MEQVQSQTEKPKANLEEMRRGSTMLTVGVVGLVILALMTLYVAIEMTQMSAEARNISYWPLFVMPVYLILGGVSLAYSARASVLYKKDLHVVSAACLVGLVLAFFGAILVGGDDFCMVDLLWNIVLVVDATTSGKSRIFNTCGTTVDGAKWW